MIFNDVLLKNYFLYEDTVLPLDDQGLVIVTGKYNLKKKIKGMSNDVGKSLLFSCIQFVAQGSLPNGKVLKSAVEDVDLELRMRNQNGKYTVRQKKNKYTVLKGKKDITPRTKPNATKLVQSLFPEPEIIGATSFVSQTHPLYLSIIEGTAANRLKILEQFMDLRKIAKIKGMLKTKTSRLEEVETDTSKIETQIKTLEVELKRFPKDTGQIKVLRTKKKKAVQVLKKSRTLLDELREDQTRFKEKKRLKEDLEVKSVSKKEIIKLQKRADRHDELISCMEQVEEEYTFHKSNKFFKLYEIDCPTKPLFSKFEYINYKKAVWFIKKYKGFSNRIARIKEDIETLREVKGEKECPTCLSELNPKLIASALKALKKEENELSIGIKKLKKKLKSVASISQVCKVYSFNKVKLSKLKKIDVGESKRKRDNALKRISYLEEQQNILDVLDGFGKTSNQRVNIANIKTKIKQEVKDKELIIQRLSILLDNKKTRKNIKKKINRLTKNLKEVQKAITEDYVYAPILAKVFSSKDIRTEVMYGFYQILVSEWNMYASSMFDTKIVFKVVEESGYPSFSYSNGKNGPESDIRFLSGGNKKRLIACMIPSILKIIPDTTNILVVDELDANLDQPGFEAMMEFFPEIIKEFKTSLFFITPKTGLKRPGYNNWVIERNGNNSCLITK